MTTDTMRATHEKALTLDLREPTRINGKPGWTVRGTRHVTVTVDVDLDQLARKLGPRTFNSQRGETRFFEGAIIVRTRRLK